MIRRTFSSIGTLLVAVSFGLLLLCLAGSPHPLAAAPAEPQAATLQLLGHLGGEITVMQPMTDRLYAGIGADLAILDISTTSTPTLLGAVTLGGQLLDIEFVGNYALVAGDPLGLHIVDITTPTAPQLLTSTQLISAPQQIAILGNLAYVTYKAGVQSGVAILNVANPASPVVVNAKVGGIAFEPLDLQIKQEHLYVVGGSTEAVGLSFNSWGHLQIFDLQNPIAPTTVAHYQTPPGPGEAFLRLVVDNDKAYVLDGGDLQIFTVAQPAAPLLQSKLPARGTVLQIAGQLAYVAFDPFALQPHGLTLLNIADPTAPQPIAHIPGIKNVAIQQQHVYVASEVGIERVDFSVPTQPQTQGAYRNWAVGGSIAAVGSTVYLGGNKPLLTAIAMNDPSQPYVSATYSSPTSHHAQKLLADGLTLYALDRMTLPADTDGVDIFTVSTPPTLQPRSRYSSTALFDAALQNNLLYLTTYHELKNAIEIVDVANPDAPIRIATVPLAASIDLHNLLIVGNHALLGAVDQTNPNGGFYPSIHIIDIATPATAKDVAIYPTVGFVWRLAVEGNRLYVLFYTTDDRCRGGVEIINIANLAAPVRLGSQCWSDRVLDFAVADSLLSITFEEFAGGTDRVGRLAVIDATFPHALAEIAVDRRIGEQANVMYGNGLLYVNSEAGLFAYRYQPVTINGAITGATEILSPQDQVRYQFPVGTFSTPVTVTHTLKTVRPQVTLPLFGLDHAFSNQAMTVADKLPVQPAQPYTVQVGYTDSEIARMDEATLALYQWVNGQWQREESSEVDPLTNTITATPTRVGIWIVAGQSPYQHYLPVLAE